MNESKKPDLKKGLSNSFVLFLIAAILAVLMIQNFLETKFAKVSFSYQLESLVNLELINPEESRKTAINDNLVSFSGKFVDRLSEESKTRYKYLELLNRNHELTSEKDHVESELAALKGKITDSGDLFLHISGIPLPANGYVIVDDLSATPEKDYGVVITSLSKKHFISLKDVQNEFDLVRASPSTVGLKQLSRSLSDLIQLFRSPTLGIGNEGMKHTLREAERNVSAVNVDKVSPAEALAVYQSALTDLNSMVMDLNQFEDHSRLNKLRSVRNYKGAMDEYSRLSNLLDDNQAQLDKIRQSVANVIWFFNNQELSTRALEKQDPELFNHWFINAKEEWDNFPANRGGLF